MEAIHFDIFKVNEKKANRYTAFCLLIAAGIAALMWILNILGFFIVDKRLMNTAMPVGVAMFLLPSFLVRAWKGQEWLLKYLIMGCFLLGLGILTSTLTIQLVMAWACPIILSCHYYSPKFAHMTLAGALFCMLCSVYIGLYFGVWDANMMRSADLPGDAAFRAAFIREAAAAGDNLLLRVFNFGGGLSDWRYPLEADPRPAQTAGDGQQREGADWSGTSCGHADSGFHAALCLPGISGI